MVDPRGQILFANAAAQEIFELSEKELLKKSCFEAFKGCDPEGNDFCFANCYVMKLATQGRPAPNFDLRITTHSGKELWTNVTSLLESTPVGPNGPHAVHIFRVIPPPLNLAQVPALMKRYSLSHREAEVLSLMTESLVAKEIGVRFGLSTSTVRTHIQNILKKLQVHSKLEAVALVLRQKRS
jgi:PAS domain S-box-containing protein